MIAYTHLYTRAYTPISYANEHEHRNIQYICTYQCHIYMHTCDRKLTYTYKHKSHLHKTMPYKYACMHTYSYKYKAHAHNNVIYIIILSDLQMLTHAYK